MSVIPEKTKGRVYFFIKKQKIEIGGVFLKIEAFKLTKNDEDFSFVPVLVNRLCGFKRIQKATEKMYQKKSIAYYKEAKASPFFHHPLITHTGMIDHYYAKRLLGILSYELREDPNGLKPIYDAIKYQWYDAYRAIEGKKTVTLKDSKVFSDHIFKKENDFGTSVLFFALKSSIFSSFKQNLDIDLPMHILSFFIRMDGLKMDGMLQHFHDSVCEHLKKIITEDKERENGYKRLIQKIDDRKMIKTIQERTKTILEPVPGHVFDDEPDEYFLDHADISSASLYELMSNLSEKYNYPLSASFYYMERNQLKKEIEDYLSVHLKHDKAVESASHFIILAKQIENLFSSLHKGKEIFYDLNEKRMTEDLEVKEKQVTLLLQEKNDIRRENENLKSEIEGLKTKLKRMEKMKYEERECIDARVESLKKGNDLSKREKEELHYLREVYYHLDREDDKGEIREDINIALLKKKNIIVVGGKKSWKDKLQVILPTITYIDKDTPYHRHWIEKADLILINTNFLNHPLFYKVSDDAKHVNKPLRFIKRDNIDLVLQQISHYIDQIDSFKVKRSD